MFVSSWWFRTKKTSVWLGPPSVGGPPSSLLRLPETRFSSRSTVGQTTRRSVVTGSAESAGTVPCQTHQDASEKEEMLLWVGVQRS